MSTGGRLLAIEVERFKSYAEHSRVEIAPITVLIGRNNSGKSALIQPLLLLKQTLATARPELPLNLAGELVSALSLRDLTHGWPGSGPSVPGPRFALEWECVVDVQTTTKRWVKSTVELVARRAGLPWLLEAEHATLKVRMDVAFSGLDDAVSIETLAFTLLHPSPMATATFHRSDNGFLMRWNGEPAASRAYVRLEHFLPYIDVGQIQLGRNDYRRAYLNGWLSCFAPAIEALRVLLSEMQYLSSARATPREVNPPVTAPPSDVGVNGSLAADMFKSRGSDLVHYLPPLTLTDDTISVPRLVRERELTEAVNDVMAHLGVAGAFSVEDAEMFGYRLLFGRASLPHVGRGLTYLLPMVEVGLLGDPCRFTRLGGDLSPDDYGAASGRSMLLAFEEPESHIHPKVQSRLAHWFVALARCQRQIIVETHSDHLVRRLRGLVARAGAGSELERWLLDSVRIYGVTQVDGTSKLTPMRLTPTGGIEDWPEDFMDEASQEDTAIYQSGLNKQGEVPLSQFVHDEGGPEPESER